MRKLATLAALVVFTAGGYVVYLVLKDHKFYKNIDDIDSVIAEMKDEQAA